MLTSVNFNSGDKLVSLQVLRAIAAIMVAVGHLYGIDQRFFGEPVLSASAQFGFAGVDLFFVLSGFVMVHLTRFGAGSASIVPAFLFARIARIYPMWWIALGAISIVWMIRPGWVFASISGAPNFLADFALWPHQRPPLLAVGWTLIHEMYFYCAFALLLLLPARRLVSGLIGWMVMVTIGNFWLTFDSTAIEASPMVTLITHPLTLDFGFGAAVGLFAARGLRPMPQVLIGFGVAWALVACFLEYQSPLILFENNWLRVVSLGSAWALIVWGMVGLETDRGYVPLKALSGLGDSSYALYLIHVPIYAACARLIAPFSGSGVLDNVISWLGLLIIAVTTAFLMHQLIERPILKLLTKLRYKFLPTGSALMPSPPPPLGMKI